MAYLLHLLALACILYIAALGLDLMFGEAGLLGLCQAAFMGIGAYTFALVAASTGSWLAGLASGVLIVAPAGYLAAWLARNLTEIEFPVVTFAVQLIVSSLFRNLDSITGGPIGLSQVPVLEPPWFWQFSRGLWSVCLVGTAAGGLTAVAFAVRGSAFGRLVRGIRDDELLLGTLGKNTSHLKASVVAVGASFASIAGALYSLHFGYIQPRAFDFSVSLLLVAVVVVGGPASTAGVLVGIIIVLGVPELLRFIGSTDGQVALIREIVFGGLLALMVRFRPRGLVGRVAIK